MSSNHARPMLRPIELRPSQQQAGAYDVVDPSGIAAGVLTVSAPMVFVFAMMNGRHSRLDIQSRFMLRFGQMLFSEELDRLITQLDKARFLVGPNLQAHMAKLTDGYRRNPVRAMRDPNSFGAPANRLGPYVDAILNDGVIPDRELDPEASGPLGLVAPHLDYPRGQPCYAAAYRDLLGRTEARRFVILGTNHFGCHAGVVGTRKDFDTPFGQVPHDGELMRLLDQRCGMDLCEGEYDHAREHSVELQVVLLARLFGDRPFTIAPYLCPDPCGPTGTKPRDGRGVDLRDFALALGEEIAAAEEPILVIAGADLSHVGQYFQDDRRLDRENLRRLDASDREALSKLEQEGAEAFVSHVAADSNSTNICSVGCIYAAAKALEGRARARVVKYHQAVTKEIENCVTCAAVEFCRA